MLSGAAPSAGTRMATAVAGRCCASFQFCVVYRVQAIMQQSYTRGGRRRGCPIPIRFPVFIWILRWPPPGWLPQRPKVLSSGGAACLSKPFAFAHLSGLVQAPACERLLRAFIKKGGITLVHTSSTSSAPQLAAVLL